MTTNKRNRKNFKYNYICKPLERNKDTGMFTISYDDIADNDKDFLFNQEVNGIIYSFVIPNDYVVKHLQWLHYVRKNEETGETKHGRFPAISFEDIMAAPRVTHKTRKSKTK